MIKNRGIRLFTAAAGSFFIARCFPPHMIFPLVWILFVPLFWIVFTEPSLMWSAVYSFIAGAVFYGTVLFWMSSFHYTALPFLSTVCGLLFFAVPLLLGKYIYRKKPYLGFWAVPALWTASEWIRLQWFLSQPFGMLAYTQTRFLYLIQSADITGFWGITFLIILVNTALFHITYQRKMKKSPVRSRCILIPCTAAAVIIFTVLVYGIVRLYTFPWGPELKAAVLQTAIDPRKNWEDSREKHLADFENLLDNSLFFEPRVVFLPETFIDRPVTITARPRIKGSAEILNRVSAAARQSGTALVIGAVEMLSSSPVKISNSILYFRKDGDLAAVYRKRRLVPFGESAPLDFISPRIQQKLNRETGTLMFTPGNEPVLMHVSSEEGRDFTFSVLICYESCFPGPARESVTLGADFLVNATNDLWSFSRDGMIQHAVCSVFRAIENRVPAVRVSNGGLSCYINPLGKMFSRLPLFAEGAMPFQMQISDRPISTVYKSLGDWFPLVCSIFSVAAAGRVLVSRLCFG